jgi:hypothetical protein
MSVINKQLYDALIAANVPEEKATAAAESVEEKIESIIIVEKELAVINARLAMVERLQWVIVAGVVGLLIKSFI